MAARRFQLLWLDRQLYVQAGPQPGPPLAGRISRRTLGLLERRSLPSERSLEMLAGFRLLRGTPVVREAAHPCRRLCHPPQAAASRVPCTPSGAGRRAAPALRRSLPLPQRLPCLFMVMASTFVPRPCLLATRLRFVAWYGADPTFVGRCSFQVSRLGLGPNSLDGRKGALVFGVVTCWFGFPLDGSPTAFLVVPACLMLGRGASLEKDGP